MDAHSLETISALIKAGQIRLGMTRTELRTLLGEPDAMGCFSPKNKVPPVWKYGEVVCCERDRPGFRTSAMLY
jgi:hypothetical protein